MRFRVNNLNIPKKIKNFSLSHINLKIIDNIQIQWKPLNVITDNVIIQILLSHSKRPSQFGQTSNKEIRFKGSNSSKIWLLL